MYGNHSLKHWDEYQSSPCVLTNILVFRYNNHCCDFESVSALWNRSPFSTVHFQRNALYSSDYNDLRTQSMKLNTSGSISMYSIGKSLSLLTVSVIMWYTNISDWIHWNYYSVTKVLIFIHPSVFDVWRELNIPLTLSCHSDFLVFWNTDDNWYKPK